MELKDLISVIVPIYNVEEYVKPCVNSIVSQTYSNLEIILVDDGSTDMSPQICDNYASQDSRFIVMHQTNKGLSEARNAGLDVSQGKYIVMVDGDDQIESNMIERLYYSIVNTKSDIVFCGIKKVDLIASTESDLKVQSANMNQKEFWEAYFSGYQIPCVVAWNKIYKSELFENLRYEANAIHEDELILQYLVSKCTQISSIEDELYLYSIRSGSIMSKPYNIRNFSGLRAMISRIDYFNELNESGLIQLGMNQAFYELIHAFIAIDSNNHEYAKEYKKYHNIFGKVFFNYRQIIDNKQKFKIVCFLLFPNVCKRIIKSKL